jgi:hypothetical protein
MCTRVGKQTGLVEELGGLEMIEPWAKRLVRLVRDRLEQGEGKIFADDGRLAVDTLPSSAPAAEASGALTPPSDRAPSIRAPVGLQPT